MQSDAFQLLERRISGLRSDHVGRLQSAGSSALEQFEPARKVTFGSSLRAYIHAASAELSAYCLRVREEVVSLTNRLLLPFPEETKARVLAIAAQAFDESLYPKRLQFQEEGMMRKGRNYGFRVNEWGMRTDIERDLHQVGTSNLIRQTLAALADELELVRLQSLREASASLSTHGGIHMPFTDLMNDTVDILKTDGTTVTGLKASVQRSKIFMDAGTLLIQPRDLVIRRMSNGAEETYRVIDPGFNEAFHDITARYQMEVQKLGLPEAKSAVQSITYNITGNNARINQNSVDNSTNIVQIDARAIQHITALRKELDQAQIPEPEKVTALEIVDEVEEAFRLGRPRKSVVSALLKSLPHVANVTSIVAALLGML